MRYLVLVAFIGLVTGCAEPGDATKVGAATGGALGAGLGAIVGSQTGDPGAGLVVGALAGAGAGAAVGNAFDARDAAIRTQDEAIERQEQILRAQRKEIQDLRQMTQDSVQFSPSSNGNASSPRARFKSEQAKRNNTNAPKRVTATNLRLPDHLKTQPLKNDRQPVRDVQQVREEVVRTEVIQEVTNTDSVRPTFFRATQERAAPQDIQPLRENTLGAQIPTDIRRAPSDDQLQPIREQNVLREEQPRQPSFVDVDEVQPEPVQEVRSRIVDEPANTPVSAECESAAGEVKQAGSAPELADKLFHYRRALRLCPDNANYHSGLGDLYLSLQREDDARFEFQEALKIDPANSIALAGMQSLGRKSIGQGNQIIGGERY